MARVLRVLAASSLLLAAQAFASGIEMGENGATTALQGGAFTGQADDLSAIEHNPAGLAQLEGFNFQVDLQLMNHAVTFLRQDPGYDPAAPSTLFNQVENKGGTFLLPLFGVSYSLPLASRQLTVALGAFGPPAVGRYAFEEPNYEKDASDKYLQNPKKFAPQRYALISNDILIYFPSLSVAYAVHPKVLLGVSGELVVSSFHFRQALYSGLSTPTSATQEDPAFDSVADVKLTGKPYLTATLGALVKPTDWLSVGVSARLPSQINASGTLDITLGEAATRLRAVVDGNAADMTLSLPLQLRAGVYLRPMKKLGVNLDFVFEDWSSFTQILLEPRDVTLTLGTGAPQPVKPVSIPKHWRDSYSGRLGLSYDVIDLVTVHAGGWYETGASSDDYFSIDFAHPDRIFLTGGATLHLKQFDITAGVDFTPTATKDITASRQLQTNTDAAIGGGVIGAGRYTTGGWTLVLGVKGRFGGAKPEASPEPATAPNTTAPDTAAPAS